jgi:hypothetical protein
MTAKSELHRPDQLLEPYFPHVTNTLILNPDNSPGFFCRFKRTGMEEIITMIQDDSCSQCENYAFLKLPVYRKESGLIHKLPKTLLQLLNIFTESDVRMQFHKWLCDLFLIMQTGEYKSRFDQTKEKFMNSHCVFVLPIPLMRESDGDVEGFDAHAFITKEPLSKVVADFGLEANHSKLQKSKNKGATGSNINLIPFNVQFDLSQRVACFYNGIESAGTMKITMIGVGALGSQIANNCVHAGYGEWTFVDNDKLWPHNIARHILTRSEISCYKAKSLAELTNKITLDANAVAVCESVYSDAKVMKKALEEVDMIIDVSASPAVEKFLALDVDTNARKVCVFLNPTGTSTVMLIEDTDTVMRLDLLEMQYLSEILHHNDLAAHLTIPDTLLYSGSCRSITSRLSQDNVALSAALVSKALKKYAKDSKASIIVWNHDGDDAIVKNISVLYWLKIEANGWCIYCYTPLLDAMKLYRSKSLPNETGGVLIGSFDYSRHILYVVDHIESPDDSISSPTSYIRGCKGLEQKLKRIEDTVMDNLYYVGEWHSHVGANTQMSSADKILMSAIIEYNCERCKPACMMIIGETGQSVYVGE